MVNIFSTVIDYYIEIEIFELFMLVRKYFSSSYHFLFSIILFYFLNFFSLSLSLLTILKRNYIGEADVTNDSRDVIRTANDTLVWFESGLIVIPGTA